MFDADEPSRPDCWAVHQDLLGGRGQLPKDHDSVLRVGCFHSAQAVVAQPHKNSFKVLSSNESRANCFSNVAAERSPNPARIGERHRGFSPHVEGHRLVVGTLIVDPITRAAEDGGIVGLGATYASKPSKLPG